MPIGSPGSVASRELVILQRSGFIAGHCRQVAVVRHGITSSGHVDTSLSSLPPLPGAVIAKLTRGVMHDTVATVSEVAITGCLIGIGCILIAFGRGLVAVGPRLVGIREGLFAISNRLPLTSGLQDRLSFHP